MKLIEDLHGRCDNGMELNIIADLFSSNVGYFMYKNSNDPSIIILSCVDNDDDKSLHRLFYALIYAVILKFPANTIAVIKDKLNTHFGIEDSEIKQIINLILNDKELIDTLDKVYKGVQAKIAENKDEKN